MHLSRLLPAALYAITVFATTLPDSVHAASLANDQRHSEATAFRNPGGRRVSSSDVSIGRLPSKVALNLGGQRRVVNLHNADLFTDDAKILYVGVDETIEKPVPGVYWGSIEDVPGSDVYLAASEAGITGIVELGPKEIWDIEPARRLNAEANLSDVVGFRNDEIEEIDLSGDTAEVSLKSARTRLGARMMSAPYTNTASLQADQIKGFRAYTVVSWEYVTNSAGGNTSTASSRAALILAWARLWMQRDLSLSMKSSNIQVYTSAAADIFIQTPQNQTIWNRLKDFRENEQPIFTAVTHAFYGGTRAWQGTDIAPGLGTVGNPCDERASVSARRNDASIMFGATISAHEIGHNLGARHSDSDYCEDDESHPTCAGLQLFAKYCANGPHAGEACADGWPDCCTIPESCTPAEAQNPWTCALLVNRPIMWSGYNGNIEYVYDECAQCFIGDWVEWSDFDSTATPASCFYGIKCGDVDSGGTIQTNDALEALKIATGERPYSPLADVHIPIGTVTAVDADEIMDYALGLATPPTSCGSF